MANTENQPQLVDVIRVLKKDNLARRESSIQFNQTQTLLLDAGKEQNNSLATISNNTDNKLLLNDSKDQNNSLDIISNNTSNLVPIMNRYVDGDVEGKPIDIISDILKNTYTLIDILQNKDMGENKFPKEDKPSEVILKKSPEDKETEMEKRNSDEEDVEKRRSIFSQMLTFNKDMSEGISSIKKSSVSMAKNIKMGLFGLLGSIAGIASSVGVAFAVALSSWYFGKKMGEWFKKDVGLAKESINLLFEANRISREIRDSRNKLKKKIEYQREETDFIAKSKNIPVDELLTKLLHSKDKEKFVNNLSDDERRLVIRREHENRSRAHVTSEELSNAPKLGNNIAGNYGVTKKRNERITDAQKLINRSNEAHTVLKKINLEKSKEIKAKSEDAVDAAETFKKAYNKVIQVTPPESKPTPASRPEAIMSNQNNVNIDQRSKTINNSERPVWNPEMSIWRAGDNNKQYSSPRQ